jgi:hypothetical protein
LRKDTIIRTNSCFDNSDFRGLQKTRKNAAQKGLNYFLRRRFLAFAEPAFHWHQSNLALVNPGAIATMMPERSILPLAPPERVVFRKHPDQSRR